jgi:AcrR family transcriptional regulator
MRPSRSGLEKINAAAVRVIGLRGFSEATTQEIAKAAGVSEGLIYRYYDTKMKLGEELFKKHHQELLATLREEIARHGDPVERQRAAAGAYFRWFDANPDVARFLLRTYSEFLDKAGEQQGLMHLATGSLRDLLGEPLFRLFPSDIIAAMILGALMMVSLECLHGQVAGPLAPRMEPIIDIMLNFIQQAVPGVPLKTGRSPPDRNP